MKSNISPNQAAIHQQGEFAGVLEETNTGWSFSYRADYSGIPVSLTLPIRSESYLFAEFPSIFEGLLPEGVMLDALMRRLKIDKDDYFSQLLAVGEDLVGSITVLPLD